MRFGSGDGDVRFGVFRDSFFEKVRLSLERDEFHPFERVFGVVVLFDAERNEEAVCAELDVLAHRFRVHADEFDGESIADEVLFDGDGGSDNFSHFRLGQLVLELGVEEAGKVAVQSFVSGNQFVREAESGHETSLLEPEDGAERSGEKNAFDGREGDETFGERSPARVAPSQCPRRFVSDARHGVYGVQQRILFLGVANVGVDEERVDLGVDVLDGDLEAVETPGLWPLDFGRKVRRQVLVDDAVAAFNLFVIQ